MDKLIRGDVTKAVMEEIRRVVPKKNLMVFVSSTFLDTNLERDILHRKILPDLQKKDQQREIQIIFYDMRFGVKDENTLDHMTWETCKEAIRQCFEGSDGLFFLSLQADRYGYLPLPKYLDADILLKARKDHENDCNFPEMTQFLTEWYKLDENHCPPRYELKRLSVLRDPGFDKVVPTLKDCLLDSVTFETLKVLPEEIVVNRSVTQWETFYALDCDKERCYWIKRVFSKACLRDFKDHPDCWKITDIFSDEFSAETTNKGEGLSTAKKLEVLHAKMNSYLKLDQRTELSIHCSLEAYLKGERREEYLKDWERVTRDCLEKELEKVIDKSKRWNEGFAGLPADHLEEIVHHCSISFTKANNFLGREELLGKALEMIKKPMEPKETDAENRTGICLAVVGKSGCGKTTLMSKLALSLTGNDAAVRKVPIVTRLFRLALCGTRLPPHSGANKIPIIIRFCGTSRYSLNGLKLIQSISLQILVIHERKQELKELVNVLPSQDYKTAVEYFHQLVSQYPIYLLIDSLDQLENRQEERSRLTFLRDLKPHAQSRIIVSTLPDEYEENGKPGRYFYQCERTLKSGSVPILDVGIMNQIEVIINSLLTSRRRKLTNDQWIVTLQAVRHEPTILYINLAMEVISQWRSFEKEVILIPTVKGLIHQIFGDLELSYGKEFTSIAFAVITFSREGVNDPELKDLLSLHEEVMMEVCQYSKLHCFPMHAWLRLKQVIKNLITEKENHCIKWYHRQLWETASERYSEKEKECREIMGKYFTNLYDIDMKKEKDIMSQPLILNEVSVWMSGSIVNRRRVVEGYYHLIKGGLLQAAVEEVCSLEFVCCSALIGDLLNCVRYLGELVRSFGDNAVPRQLDHFYRWMRKKATRIILNPQRQTRMTAGDEPLISVVKERISQLDEMEQNELGRTMEVMTFGGYEDDFDAVELELVGHTGGVESVTWNHDDSKILSGSADRTLKIWDAMTGELLHTLDGHLKGVLSVAWNHDSSRIVSGSYDGTVKIWNGITCELLMTLNDNGEVNSVSWSHNGWKIASGSSNAMVCIWNAITGELLLSLPDCYTNCVFCVAWNHDDSKLLSCSNGKMIKIWNTTTGELLKAWNPLTGEFLSKSLKSPPDAVTSASWNYDSSLIVSGSARAFVKIWDGLTGALLKTLRGHKNEVHTVIWNRDGSKILSGSKGGTIKIWDALTGGHEESVVQTSNDSVAWNHDESRIVSGSENGTIRVWKGWGKEAKKNSVSGITSLSEWNPVDSTRIVSGSEDGTVEIWDGLTGKLLKSWKGHSDRVTCIAWNHDGTRIASVGPEDKTIKIWDGVTYDLVMTLEGPFEAALRISWNRDGNRILAIGYSMVLLWKGITVKPLETVELSSNGIGAIFWNHDSSKLLIALNNGGIAMHNGETLRLERQVCGSKHMDDCSVVSWNHDCSKIISSSSNTIRIWTAESGALLKTLTGHSGVVLSLFWNHDDSRIFSGSHDGTIRIWDGTTGQLLKTETLGCSIWAMSLTKKEDRIAFFSRDGPFVRSLPLTKS
jgi:WD40 repeat protein/GTPase SAR1 family protein